MADFSTVAISVAVTLTLQSAYLSFIKFPRLLESETNALQSASRKFTAEMDEGNLACTLSREASELAARVNDHILAGNDEKGRRQLVENYEVLDGQLTGFAGCKEPEGTHLAVVRESLKKTADLLSSDLDVELIRHSMRTLAYTNKLSLKLTSLRINQARTGLADELEEHQSAINSSLLEFYAASILAYIGMVGIVTFLLYRSCHWGWLRERTAICIWATSFFFFNWVVGRLRVIGNSAKNVVLTTAKQVKFTREHLVDLQ